ncbi:Hypothetical protein POVN_LOCUS617, partial [uncultured virus]
VGETTYSIKEGAVVLVLEGTPYSIKNTSEIEALKLYTIYAPPHHPNGLIQTTKPAGD